MTSKWNIREHRVVSSMRRIGRCGFCVSGVMVQTCHVEFLLGNARVMPQVQLDGMDLMVQQRRMKSFKRMPHLGLEEFGQERLLLKIRVGHSTPGDARVGCLDTSTSVWLSPTSHLGMAPRSSRKCYDSVAVKEGRTGTQPQKPTRSNRFRELVLCPEPPSCTIRHFTCNLIATDKAPSRYGERT